MCNLPHCLADPEIVDVELLKYAFLALGYPFTSLTPQERTLMVGIKLFQKRYEGTPLPPPLSKMDASLKRMKTRYDALKLSFGGNFNLTQYIVNNSAR